MCATPLGRGKSSTGIVFDIGGGDYRMICQSRLRKKDFLLFICGISAHAEYDKINKAGKQHTINLY